ncbi:MAG: class I SAM-dependent methyltransferase [Actinomycetota bacterium]
MTATTGTTLNQADVEAFVGRVLGDTSGTLTTFLAAVGDRLGLFKDLAVLGPVTAPELAERSGVNERYAREWLAAMAAAGYLDYDPATTRFTLPPEHAPALAEEAGPYFFGGPHQMIIGLASRLDEVVRVFREGGGLSQSGYGAHWWDGMERFTNGWFENLLLPVWIPAMPEVERRLERGATLADVGCGRGRALVRLATAFPNSSFVGYDVFEPSVARARILAESAGVADRVRFEVADGAGGLPEQYDIITTFDVVHDAVDPRGLLRSIRRALRPGGIYVCLDIHCSERLEENLGPLGALFLGFSVMYCMTTSLAGGGEGLGTVGFHEPKVRELCGEAGFSAVRAVPIDNPFHNLYEIRP